VTPGKTINNISYLEDKLPDFGRFPAVPQVEQYRTDLETLRADHAATQTHMRAVENRSYQLVDRARLEVKALQQQLEREQREHSKAVAQLTTQQENLRDAARLSRLSRISAVGAEVFLPRTKKTTTQRRESS